LGTSCRQLLLDATTDRRTAGTVSIRTAAGVDDSAVDGSLTADVASSDPTDSAAAKRLATTAAAPRSTTSSLNS